MTQDERKVIELALEALETPWNAPYVDGCDLALGKRVKAITAIKEALAQPEQAPVLVECGNCHEGLADMEHVCKKCLGAGWVNNPQLKEPEQEPVAWMQEPVAWMYPDALCDRACLYLCTKGFTQFPECATTPPQRTWVGLADDDIVHIGVATGLERIAVNMIEAKLKELNNERTN